MKKDSHSKSLRKSVIWRIIGIFWLATITWIFTRNWIAVSLITFIHHGVFIIVFYLHERAWLESKISPKIKYGLKAVTYEIILGNLILALISYLVTGSVHKMTIITLSYIQSKIVFYYFYDWLWSRHQITVYAFVVCEIFHIGHLRALINAKKHGDFLIIGVCSDEAVKEKERILKAAPSVIPFEERIEIVRNIKCVDRVVPQTVYSPLENLTKIKPNILMESSDHPRTFSEARTYVESYGGKVIINPYYRAQSVTKIKKKIVESSLP